MGVKYESWPRWSEKEDKLIRELYPKLSALTWRLRGNRRTPSAIYNRALKLGVAGNQGNPPTQADVQADIERAKEHLRDLRERRGTLAGCTSYVQRKMGIGYNRAAELMEQLERAGFITAPNSSGERRFQ